MVDVSPRVDQPKLGIYGLLVSKASDSTLEISAGRCKDSSNKIDIGVGSDYAQWTGGSVSAPLTIDVSVVGANGIDAGSLAASKVYSVYVIADSSGEKSVAGLCSLASNSTPTLPFGYDAYRLVGYAVTDSSVDFLDMYQMGKGHSRKVLFDVIQGSSVTAGAATTYTAVDLSALVPPVSKAQALVEGVLTPGAAGRKAFFQSYDGTGAQAEIWGQVTSVLINAMHWIPLGLNSGAPSIKYKVSNAGDALDINVAGFAYEV